MAVACIQLSKLSENDSKTNERSILQRRPKNTYLINRSVLLLILTDTRPLSSPPPPNAWQSQQPTDSDRLGNVKVITLSFPFSFSLTSLLPRYAVCQPCPFLPLQTRAIYYYSKNQQQHAELAKRSVIS